MKAKTTKILAVLGIVGALAHVLSPLGFSVLGLFDNFWGYADVVQVIAGASGVIALSQLISKKR